MKTYDLIAAAITNKEQKVFLIQELGEILGNMHSVESGFKNSVALVEALEKEGIDLKNKAAVKEYLEGLIEYLEELPVVTLSLAQNPSLKMTQALSDWFKKNVTKNTVLEIKVDPSIIAGVLVQYQGIYKNYSLNKLIEK